MPSGCCRFVMQFLLQESWMLHLYFQSWMQTPSGMTTGNNHPFCWYYFFFEYLVFGDNFFFSFLFSSLSLSRMCVENKRCWWVWYILSRLTKHDIYLLRQRLGAFLFVVIISALWLAAVINPVFSSFGVLLMEGPLFLYFIRAFWIAIDVPWCCFPYEVFEF